MAKISDPTKDPKFQQVVQTFLRTPPQPRDKHAGSPKPKAKAKKKDRRK